MNNLHQSVLQYHSKIKEKRISANVVSESIQYHMKHPFPWVVHYITSSIFYFTFTQQVHENEVPSLSSFH